MNNLTSQQRKLVYLVGIVVLLIPIIALGLPGARRAGTGSDGAAVSESSGGILARLRTEHDLGESTLGNVDPASATMNLVLLGLRGVAVNVLWLEHDEFKRTKNWPQMRAAAESIILLQPHYLQVWRYQGWDLAYNVSAEWDAVPDRWYWVKEGGKFIMQGTRRNSRYGELYFDVGTTLGKKVGRSDEWSYFRKYFTRDPKEDLFKGGPDPGFNRDPRGGLADDNYLCAKEWFHEANEIEGKPFTEHIMMLALYRSYPARSQFDYADALQREGVFDEKTRLAWQEAFEDWTFKYRNDRPGYGQELVVSEGGLIRLESSDEDIKALSKQDGVPEADKRRWTEHYRKTVNYTFWRTKAQCEREELTVEAHQEIYRGQQLFKEGKLRESVEMLESGMTKYAKMLERFQGLVSEDLSVEEALTAVLYWRYALRLLDAPVPEEFVLKPIWLKEQGRVPELERRFRTENGIQTN